MNEKTIKGSEKTSKLQERLRKQRPMFLKMAEQIEAGKFLQDRFNAEFHGERY